MNKLIIPLIFAISIPATANSQLPNNSSVGVASHDHGSHRKGHRHRRGLRLFHKHHSSHGKHHGRHENHSDKKQNHKADHTH